MLGSAKCSIPDLGARDGDRDEPARIDGTIILISSTNLDRTFLCPAPPCMPSSCSTIPGAVAQPGCAACPPAPAQHRCSLTRSPLPALPCSPSGTTACRWAVERPWGDKEAPRAKRELPQQADSASHFGVILLRGRQNGQTDASLAKTVQLDFPSFPHLFLLFFFSFNFVSEAMIL